MDNKYIQYSEEHKKNIVKDVKVSFKEKWSSVVTMES